MFYRHFRRITSDVQNSEMSHVQKDVPKFVYKYKKNSICNE